MWERRRSPTAPQLEARRLHVGTDGFSIRSEPFATIGLRRVKRGRPGVEKQRTVETNRAAPPDCPRPHVGHSELDVPRRHRPRRRPGAGVRRPKGRLLQRVDHLGGEEGRIGAAGYEARVRELVGKRPMLVLCMEALLTAREVLRRELNRLHLALLRVVKNDELGRRFMTIPGVGPVTALAFKTTVDRPERFRRSADVGAHLGLTPRQYQSGEVDRRGRITRCGDTFTRTALFAAANVMLSRTTQWTALKAWGTRLAARSSLKKAKIAVARKLAVIMHRMWRDETPFRWTAA
jgi:transposase